MRLPRFRRLATDTTPSDGKRGPFRMMWHRVLVPIIARGEWGARTAELEQQPGAWRGKVTLVVHHTVTQRAKAITEPAGTNAVLAVDRVHASNAGGIGYNYLASGGALFEGRGFEVVAAAAFDDARGIGWNRGRYVHVAIPGDYTRSGIAAEDMRAVDDLTVHLGRRGAKVASIIGHGDLMPTACPGTQGRRDLAAYFGKRWKGRR